MTDTHERRGLEAIEIDLLVEGVRRHYGIDLESYARPLLLRRLRQSARQAGLGSISALQARVLHDAMRMEELLASITSDTGRLFEEPQFFAMFRERTVPWLKTHPSVRLWHVGCATPEEIYALAIVLQEEGLLARSRIYVTDASSELLRRAQTGEVSIFDPTAEERYLQAGGRKSLSDYLQVGDGRATLHPALQERIFYTQHHLAHDGALNEFHGVLCRNTLLYFSRQHHAHIHGLLFESLARFGFLGLGRKESLRHTPYQAAYDEIEGAGRLYRRVS